MKHVKLFEDYSSPGNDIDNIRYGNTTLEKMKVAYVEENRIRDWFIAEGIADTIIQNAPLNSSATTKKELDDLLSKTERISSEDLTFARYVDDESNLAQSYIDLLADKGIEITMGDFFSVDSQLEPLIFWLKDKIDRPRPYQLARAYDMPLYPSMHTDAMTSAYPSGHAGAAFLMSEYFSRKYPNHRAELLELGERIAMSRENTGIHFRSDTEISREIVKIVFENNLLIT
jgi:hypothetical protein